MKQGEVVKGYRITTAPTNSGGGMCVWAFAAKSGRDYFIKEFLHPKWPLPESMGTEASKVLRRKDCAEFEGRHNEVMRRLSSSTATPGGGNLVIAVDFFREGTAYYKVTERIVTASLTSLRDLPTRDQAVILRTLVLSLQILHRSDIVHGDLKPANVLIQRVPGSTLHTAKLIDFDDSYLSGSPPPREQIVGDSIYAAPEWFGYTMGDTRTTPAMLTRASDVFALALLFHYYLTDELPAFDRARFSAPGQAVQAGGRLAFDPRLSSHLAGLLAQMTSPRPKERPAIDQVFNGLKDEARLALSDPVAATGASASRVRVNTMPRAAEGTGAGRDPKETSPGDGAVSASRVRVNLSGKKDPRSGK